LDVEYTPHENTFLQLHMKTRSCTPKAKPQVSEIDKLWHKVTFTLDFLEDFLALKGLKKNNEENKTTSGLEFLKKYFPCI